MAPRSRKIRHDDETRSKIQASQLINRLEAHVLSDLDLKPSQVNAALGLLKKVVPDLSSVDMHAEHDISDPLKELLGAVNGRTRGLPNSG